jgi:transposase
MRIKISQILKNYKKLKKEHEDLQKENSDLLEELEKIKREFNKYKNSNTPSSSNKHLKPKTKGDRIIKGSIRGAPKGHKGKTRKQNPTSFEVIDGNECPNCGSFHLADEQIFNKVIEEIPEPILPETKRYEIHKKKCLDCNLSFIPKGNFIPLKGKFGINIMVLVIFLKFILRGVLRKTTQFLNAGFMFKITPSSVNTIIGRVAEAAETEYSSLKLKIRLADLVYVDETSFSVLGINQWVWVFRTSNDILLVIRPSRGNNVLSEILGKYYSGKVVCDCWRAYNFLEYADIQRCWAHLLRKSESLSEYVAGSNFHRKLKSLFKEIKIFNDGNPSQEERLLKYNQMTTQLKKIMKYYEGYDDFESVAKYIKFNLNNWFTCVKFEGIEPTNNIAERAIRETVVIRKIIGAFRSEKGKKNYEILASLIATWQLQELDLKIQLKQMLKKNLCFC